MRTKKRVPITFRYYDCDAFAAYLNIQAKKGWHFKEFRMGMVFERGVPEERFYAVEVFLNGSEWEEGPTPVTEEYADYCDIAGWRFVDSIRKFCVFERVHNDAQPIVTEEEHRQNVWKAQRGKHFLELFTAAMLCILCYANFSMPLSQDRFFDQHRWIYLIFSLVLFGESLLDLGIHFVWYHSQKKRLRTGMRMFVGGKGEKRYHTARNLIFLLAVAVLAGERLFAQGSGETLMLVMFFAAVYAAGIIISYLRPEDGFWVKTVVGTVLVCALLVVMMVLLALEGDVQRTVAENNQEYQLEQNKWQENSFRH